MKKGVLPEPTDVAWADLVTILPLADEYDADDLDFRLRALPIADLTTRTPEGNSLLAYIVTKEDDVACRKLLDRLRRDPAAQTALIVTPNKAGKSCKDMALQLKSPARYGILHEFHKCRHVDVGDAI